MNARVLNSLLAQCILPVNSTKCDVFFMSNELTFIWNGIFTLHKTQTVSEEIFHIGIFHRVNKLVFFYRVKLFAQAIVSHNDRQWNYKQNVRFNEYAENGHRSRYLSSISVGIVLNRHHNSHFQCYNSIIRCQKCTQVTSVVQFPAKLTITLKYLSVHSSLRVNWEHRCFSGQHFVPMERLFRN